MNKRVQNLSEQIERWPLESQAEVVDLIDEIEVNFLSRARLAEEDIAALVESEEDVRLNRYASDADIAALFSRYQSS